MLTTQLIIPLLPTLPYMWMVNGPFKGLIIFFTMLGLVFILKAVENLGFNVWVDLRNELILFWLSKIRKRKFFRVMEEVAARTPARVNVLFPVAAPIEDAGDVLFPGQPSFVQALTLAYSDGQKNEEHFYPCCNAELENIRDETRENTEKEAAGQKQPPSILPRLTDEITPQKQVHVENKPKENALTRELQDTGKVLEIVTPGDTDRMGEEITGGSIFTELLLKCDSETRLSLMPELVAVGDEKELKLLESMTVVEDRRVRKLALKLCHKLRKQLQLEKKQAQNAYNNVAGSSALAGNPNTVDGSISGLDSEGEDKLSLDMCFLPEAAKGKSIGGKS